MDAYSANHDLAGATTERHMPNVPRAGDPDAAANACAECPNSHQWSPSNIAAMPTPEERQRIAAYGVARKANELLLVRASASTGVPGTWWLPGGGLAFGESPRECLAREFREETGLRVRVGTCWTSSRTSVSWLGSRCDFTQSDSSMA